MNYTGESESLLLEDLEADYMERMGVGDRKAFDFALENSDKANYAQQALCMAVVAAGAKYERLPIKTRAPALALLAVCARQSFLDVVEREVAPLWAQHELPKRIEMHEQMREEHEHPELA